MTGTEGERVLTRDVSSGRIHKRIRTAAGLVPYGGEADNSDDAGRYEIVDETALEGAEPGDLCQRCFQDGQTE